ncbi:transposase [Metallosphaera yellowstonensis]|uniref:transposase n=1 Tax=Metallosphaera yellowstonensis TaxID=1111107 RepID=UPI001FE0EA6E|nr:transposase [Metallosphaera yellowstonensis]
MTDNVVSRLRSNRAHGRVGPGDPRGGGGAPPSGIPPGVYYADLTLGGRAIMVKLLVRERKRDSGTHARYLYTTDLSLSGEEACRVGDRGAPKDVKALGPLILEEGEASGLPHDLHRQQRRQGADRGAEPEERGGVPQALERHLGGPPGLMKIFKLR